MFRPGNQLVQLNLYVVCKLHTKSIIFFFRIVLGPRVLCIWPAGQAAFHYKRNGTKKKNTLKQRSHSAVAHFTNYGFCFGVLFALCRANDDRFAFVFMINSVLLLFLFMVFCIGHQSHAEYRHLSCMFICFVAIARGYSILDIFTLVYFIYSNLLGRSRMGRVPHNMKP